MANDEQFDLNSIDKLVERELIQKRAQQPQQQLQQQGKAQTQIGLGDASGLEQLTQKVLEAYKKKGTALNAAELAAVFRQLGANLEDYAVCQLCGNGEGGVYYIGNEKPKIKPEHVPKAWLIYQHGEHVIAKEDDMWPCAEHRAPAELVPEAAKTYNAKPQSIDWLIIEKWERLQNPQEVNAVAEQNNLPYRIIEYKALHAKDKPAARTTSQALIFLDGAKRTKEQKQDILWILGGKRPQKAETTTPAQAPAYAPQQAYQTQQQQTTVQPPTAPESIEELLPQGEIELSTLQIIESISYHGSRYEIKNPAMVNQILVLTQQGYRVNPEDAKQVIFTGQDYVTQNIGAAEARKDAARRVIAIDTLVDFIRQNPAKREEALQTIQKVLGGPQQTL